MTVALAVSGCSGAGPGAATPPPSTSIGNVSQLYNLGNLHAYAYSITGTMDGRTSTSNYSISYTDTTYHDVAARHTLMTIDTPANGSAGASQILADVYTGLADDSTLGGHIKMVFNGRTLLDQDLLADDASIYTSNDLAASANTTDNTSLVSTGTETVTIDGKSYACTIYTYTSDGTTYTIWHTPQAPMPVKTRWTDDKGTYTMELVSWS